MSSRNIPSVLWREGMFLAPQHMQAFSREVFAGIHRFASLGMTGDFGWRTLEVDEEALARGVFLLRSGEAVFPDGTAAAFPDNAGIESRDFGGLFSGSELDVYVGIAAARPNVPQVGEDGAPSRYSVETRTVYDENLRDASKEIEFRHLQGRLFFGDEDRTGYECLPVARVVRRGQPEAIPCLSETYLPPMVACGASARLMHDLGEIAADARMHARDLSGRIPATAVLSSAAKGADLAGFVKLQAINRSLAALEQLAGLPDVHPRDTYLWLTQVAGNLAVFGQERVLPELAPYHHEKLHECFPAVMALIRELLAADVAIPYDRVRFDPDPAKAGFFEVEIPEDWQRFNPIFYLAVELARPPEEVVQEVSGKLKLVAPQDVDRVLKGVVSGIELAHVRNAPLSFPKRADMHYFRIEGEGGSRGEWLNVTQTRRATVLSVLPDANYYFYVELRQ